MPIKSYLGKTFGGSARPRSLGIRRVKVTVNPDGGGGGGVGALE